jgi:hypothetical protein
VAIKFGVYFYPWYHRDKWIEAPIPHQPLKGLYDSRDPEVVSWQMELIARTGFDYVIFEFVPLNDWNFGPCVEATEQAIKWLKMLGMKWSFLADIAVLPRSDQRALDAEAMVRDIEQRGWTDGLITGASGKPLLMGYAPLPDEAAHVCRTFPSYEWRFPIWLPHWNVPDEDFEPPVHDPFAVDARARSVTIYDSLVAKGYVAFWESSPNPRNFDGYSGIMPGYYDLLLQRECQLAPQVQRGNGDTLTRQFQNVLATQPKHMLVYSWNEYFEGSVIEPTVEDDHFYVDLMARFIRQAREHEG